MVFRPLPSKYFVVHLEVVTTTGLVVRISFSNIFKEFKSTATWLQFPFKTAEGGEVEGAGGRGGSDGPDSSPTRWTFLSLNLKEILSRYLFSGYSYLKNVKLCSNMLVRNAFTSDVEYSPLAVAMDTEHGQCLRQLPRDMSLPLAKDAEFLDVYDYVCFPSAEKKLALLSEQRQQLKGIKAGSEGVVLVSQPKGEGTRGAPSHVTKAAAGTGSGGGGGGGGGLKSSDHKTKLNYRVVKDSEPSGCGRGVEGTGGHVTADLDGGGRKLADHNVVMIEHHRHSKSQRGKTDSGEPAEGGGRKEEEDEMTSSEGSVHVHAQQGTEVAIHRGNKSVPERVIMKAKPTVSLHGHACTLYMYVL